jgi:uncharacterized protein (UPF0276 family)
MTDPIPVAAGIGLRFPHHAGFLAMRPDVGWIEVHTENYLSGPAQTVLERVRRDYPVSLHGVGLSLGSADGVDEAHLDRVAMLAARIAPGLISEHLAWMAVDHAFLADLLPLPLTEESLAVMSSNVMHVQDRLGRRILVENPSTYLQFAESMIPEPEFLTELVARTGCGILCDVNNVAVSSANHGWDPAAYLCALPAEAVGEYHLAGHGVREIAPGQTLRLDTHDRSVDPAVWELFDLALALIGPRPTLIEWDTALPPLAVLLAEATCAAGHLARATLEKRDVHAA